MIEIWTILTPVLRFAFYPALLLAVGGVVFSMLMARHLGQAGQDYTARVTGRAALVGLGLAAAACSPPLARRRRSASRSRIN